MNIKLFGESSLCATLSNARRAQPAKKNFNPGSNRWLASLGVASVSALLAWAPMGASAQGADCEEFEKQVSVDGGVTWVDADDEDSAPTQVVGGGAMYRFIVTNCFKNKVCERTIVRDDDLGISSTLVPGSTGDGILVPLEQVIITQDDDGFENLNQPDRCDTPGIKKNTALERTTVVPPGFPDGVETFTDPAFVNCGDGPPPDIMIEKFTNGHDGDNANGIPDADEGDMSTGPGAVTVAEIPSGGDITWTYRVTNTGTEALENIVVTDSKSPPDGPVQVVCPPDILEPGGTLMCTATGVAENLQFTGGDVLGCGAFGQGETRPTYENEGKVTAMGVTSGLPVEDEDPSHYCNPLPPPDCGLTVDKTCELPPPPGPPEGKCDGKLQQFTMIWDGADDVDITGLSSGTASASSVEVGQEVTFTGPFSNNDVVVNITGGQSTFHVSCSDKDMDGDTTTNEDQQQVSSFGRDCGKDQGNGKGSSGINQWLLEGFRDKEGAVLDCTADSGAGATSCEIQSVAADCKSPTEKPEQLTWLYSGGGCGASDNDQKQSGDLFCTGSVNGNLPATITDDKGNVFNVGPDGTFTTSRDASKEFSLSNSGGTEENGRHVSCSQPLQAGDVYGSLTLAALNGAGIGSDVLYAYEVSNGGVAAVDNISVVDNQLGLIPGSGLSLGAGESETLTATAFISETTTNIATVDGDGLPGAECEADSNPVKVTVLSPPPCSVSIAFDKLEDDKIKWKLTNNGQGNATLETFTLDFPSDFDVIKKVKLDGDIYKADDSNLVVGPGVTIGEDDWTEDKVEKRQIEQGKTEKLEVEFEEKDKDAVLSDFELLLEFNEGACTVQF